MSEGTVRVRWYPAGVVLPDGGELRKKYVIIMDGGEHAGVTVFGSPDVPVFHAAVDWSKTTLPKRPARNTGIDIHLADGRVLVVTPGASCRCGALGMWRGPVWGQRVAVAS